jgi:hypothetical protein
MIPAVYDHKKRGETRGCSSDRAIVIEASGTDELVVVTLQVGIYRRRLAISTEAVHIDHELAEVPSLSQEKSLYELCMYGMKGCQG